MTTDSDGARLRRLRKRAGLTQAEFASLMGRSQSWVSAAENGDITLDSIALINAAATVLRCHPADLTGVPQALASPAEQRARVSLDAIRRVIQRWDLPPDWPVEPRPAAQLAAAVADLTVLRRRARYADLGEAVPDVLRELHAAADHATGHGRERAFGLLAMAYKEADTVAHNMGCDDLATLAVERFRWAAGRAGSPDLEAMGDYLRVRDLWAHGLHGDALSVLSARLDAGRLDASVAGSLYLRAAITAARSGDEDGAFDWIGEARRAADGLPDARDPFGLTFSPANVAIHAVSVAVESMDGAHALQLAASTRLPADTSRSRTARYRLDVGRGCVYHGAYDRAVAEIEAAERLAPLMIHNSPHARAAVRTLIERRGSRERVRRLANRMGLS